MSMYEYWLTDTQIQYVPKFCMFFVLFYVIVYVMRYLCYAVDIFLLMMIVYA